jgi:hypothetical protein
MFHKYHLLNQLQVFMRYKKSICITITSDDISHGCTPTTRVTMSE